MTVAIERTPNIGKVLGSRLRAVGIATEAELLALGDEEAFHRLKREFASEACGHTRLALAGAVRGVRWSKLDKDLRADLLREAESAASAAFPSPDPADAA